MSKTNDDREKAFQEWYDRQKYSVGAIPDFFQVNEMERAFIAGIGYAAAADKWVRCDERLPEERKWYECTVKENMTPKPYVMNVAWSGSWRKPATAIVIAWRELPEPFHQQEDEGK